MCRRWYPMLIPRPVVSQYKTTVMANNFQVKKKRPAMAPMWRSAMMMQLGQLILALVDFPKSLRFIEIPVGIGCTVSS